MPRILDRIRELRLKYGPLVKLMENSQTFLKLVENRPLLQPVLEKLRPQPLYPENFVEELQRLLIDIEPGSPILICSPFLYSPAVEKYLGLVETATRRGVKITIYTLSPEHRSIRDKETHRKLIEKLRNTGAEVRERMNMHEKAVVALGEKTKVAYFGSLNPLSKYKGKADYMLKFTHPEVVNSLYLFLETLAAESERQEE